MEEVEGDGPCAARAQTVCLGRGTQRIMEGNGGGGKGTYPDQGFLKVKSTPPPPLGGGGGSNQQLGATLQPSPPPFRDTPCPHRPLFGEIYQWSMKG